MQQCTKQKQYAHKATSSITSSKHWLYTVHTYMHVYIMCALSVCVCEMHAHACALHVCIARLCANLSAWGLITTSTTAKRDQILGHLGDEQKQAQAVMVQEEYQANTCPAMDTENTCISQGDTDMYL